jgi:hypothetical protein
MNVKNLLGLGISPTERATTQSLQKVDRTIKSDNTNDRDANGQQFYDGQEKKKHAKMTREQFLRALAILNEKAFMKEMLWTAFEINDNNYFYADVRDTKSNTIRKIGESDLWELFEDVRPGEEKKGQLLKKTA